MAYLDNFNPEKIDSIPEAKQQFRFLKKAIDNGEIGSGGGGAVDSVNGKTGVVVLDAEDVGAYAKLSGGIPATDLASAVQTSLGKADAAAPQSTTYTKSEVDTALAIKQNSGDIATINNSDITHGGNVSIVATEGQTITVDAYPTSGSSNAVSGDGVVSGIKNNVSLRYGEVVFETSAIIYKRIKKVSSAYKWASDYYCLLIPTTANKKYRIESNASYSTQYCFLSSGDTTLDATPNWATGYTEYIELDISKVVEVIAPANATYLYIYVGNASMHRAPRVFLIDTDAEEKINTIAENTFVEAPKRGDFVYGISNNGKFGADEAYYHDAIKVKTGDTFVLYNNGDSNNARYCFATDTTSARNTTIPLVSGTNVYEVKAHSRKYIICPTDCYLLYNSLGYVNCHLKQSSALEMETMWQLAEKKILVIGDSWGRDIATELWSVARDMNLNLFVAQSYQGGSSLYNQYKGMDDATRHYTHGSFEQYTQGTYQLWEYNSATPIKTPNTGYNNGKCGVNDGTAWGKDSNSNWVGKTLAEILASQDWDIILIRLHCGDLQNIASLTTEDDTLGFFDINDFIARMEQELTDTCLAKVKWGLSTTWAYPEEAALTYTPVASVLNALGITNWNSLSDAQKQEVYAELYPNIEANFPLVCNHVGNKLSYAIDIAKAIQFGRKSNWLKDVAWHMNRSSTDTHLGNGIPKYLCALSLIYSMFKRTKNDVMFNYLPDLSDGGGDGGTESNPTTPTKALCIGASIVAWAAMCNVTTSE